MMTWMPKREDTSPHHPELPEELYREPRGVNQLQRVPVYGNEGMKIWNKNPIFQINME